MLSVICNVPRIPFLPPPFSVIYAVSRFLPDVTAPATRVSGMEKAAYTVGAVALYIWASQIRLYGLNASSTSDPLYLVNTPLGASGGSLMSLGVLPVILASYIAQLGFGCGIRRVMFFM